MQDPQGRPVAAATLTLVSGGGATERSAASDSTGAYRFDNLPAGDYLLRSVAPGFAPYLADAIRLAAGASQSHSVRMELARVHEQVVVTAAGTPQSPDQLARSLSVVDSDDADARGAATIADSLGLVAGLRVQRLGGPGAFTTIQTRGMRDQDTAVLLDGLRLRDASGTQADASSFIEDLLFTDADRVEVLRGAGSSLYGTNAVGGVVNVIAREGGGRTRGSLLLEGGSLASFRGRAQVAGEADGGRFDYSAGVADTGVERGLESEAPYRDLNLQTRVSYRISPTLRLTARLFAADSFGKIFGEPGILGSPSGFGTVDAVAGRTFTPSPPNPDNTHAARFAAAALVLSGQPTAALDYTLSYQLVSNGRRYGDGPAGTDYQPAGSTRSVYDGRIHTANGQAHYRLGSANLLTAGYEFERETFANDNSDSSDPSAVSATNVTQLSHAVFAQDQLRLFGGRLLVGGGFRAQWFSVERPLFQPLAAAPYQGSSFANPPAAYTGDGSAAWFFRSTGTKVRSHLGRGYRAPSLFERFGAGYDPVYGYSVYGDPRLRPEQSTSLDAGIDQSFLSSRVKTSATYFYTWRRDVINFDTSGLIDAATDPFGRYIGYLNAKGGIARGVELNASLVPVRSLTAAVAYTYANAIEREPIVGDVIQAFVVPRHQFSAQVAEQVSSRLTLTMDTRASGDYLAPVYGDSVTQTYRFGGIRQVNLGASYRVPMGEYRAIRFFVRTSNVFNQTYFENGFATPGRMAFGGMQFEF